MSERVRIQLGDSDSRIVERYEITQSFFSQPGAFAVRVGHGGVSEDLSRAYPPGTPFTFWIDLPDGRQVPQMTGVLDDNSPEGSAGATENNLRGRDWMMPVYKSMPRVERTFSRATYKELATAVLKEALGSDDFELIFSNDANAAAIQGVPKFEKTQVTDTIREFVVVGEEVAPHLAVTGFNDGVGPIFGIVEEHESLKALDDTTNVRDVVKLVGYDVPNPLRAKPGTTWLTFLQQELTRAGLFIFAGWDERTFIVTRPNAGQPAKFRIRRKQGYSPGIIGARHKNSTAQRYSHYVVYGRGGGGKDGRKQIKGEYVDQEMVAAGLLSVWSHVDELAKTSKQAEYLARRRAAEDRRNGWDLAYTFDRHAWPLIGEEDKTGILAIDTMFDVVDEVYGISGLFWCSQVTHRDEGQGKRTEIVLARPGDLLFGDDVVALGPKTAGRKKVFGK